MNRMLLVVAAASVLVLGALLWRRLRGPGAWTAAPVRLRAGVPPVPVPVLQAASTILVNMAMRSFLRPDGYPMEELLAPGDPRDRDLTVAAPAVFAGALSFLLSTGAVIESGGRFLPSPAAQAAVDGLYPRVGLGGMLEQGVEAYLRSRPLRGAVERFAPDDAEIRAAYAAHAARTGPL